jgi:drug/metabolite transporter (DMT)-like permease
MNPARLRAYIEILIASIIWGVAGPIIKFTLGGIDATTFLAYRFGISSLIAIVIFLFIGLRIPKDKKTLGDLLLYGFLTSTVALGFLFFGLENTTVLDMSLITLANPLIITLAGVWFLAEHVTKREKIGMAIALFGTALTVIEPLIQNGGGSVRLSGNILIVGYLVATAWAAVLAKRLLRAGITPLLMANISFLIGFISFLPFVITRFPETITNLPIQYHLGVFYMAVLSGSLAYYLHNRGQKTIEIGEASIFAYLYPLFSTPLAVFWLGEKITPIFIIGGIIIALGVTIAEIKKKRYN